MLMQNYKHETATVTISLQQQDHELTINTSKPAVILQRLESITMMLMRSMRSEAMNALCSH